MRFSGRTDFIEHGFGVVPEVDALGAAVLADGALARGVRQVHPQQLVVARARDEGCAEAQQDAAQVQHEAVRHVALPG